MKFCREKLYGKLFDIHTHSVGMDLHHLMTGKYPISQNILDLSKIVRDNCVDYAVTFPQCTTLYYNTPLIWEKSIFEPSGFCDFPYQYENSTLVRQISQLQIDNLIPFLSISSQAKVHEQISHIQNLWNSYGIYGLKFHSTTERSTVLDGSFRPFVDLAIDLNIPIMLHTAHDLYAHPIHAIKLASQYPKLRVCLAHAARFDLNVINIIKDKKLNNVFVDCAPLLRLCSIMRNRPYLEGVAFVETDYHNSMGVLQYLYELLPNNLLWGTDIPCNRYKDNDCKIIDYNDDVGVIMSFKHKKNISENSINFLFGQ